MSVVQVDLIAGQMEYAAPFDFFDPYSALIISLHKDLTGKFLLKQFDVHAWEVCLSFKWLILSRFHYRS